MNSFYGTFLNCSFVLLWVRSSKRLHSKVSLLKARKASKAQEEILTCALQNGCSKVGKILGESQCWSSVLETLSCNFIKIGLHRWHFPRKLPTFFGQTITQKHLGRLIWEDVHQIIIVRQGNCGSVIGKLL